MSNVQSTERMCEDCFYAESFSPLQHKTAAKLCTTQTANMFTKVTAEHFDFLTISIYNLQTPSGEHS